MQNYVILVDRDNKTLDYAEKLRAHHEGLLHRAFSVFVYRYNKEGKIEHLLQQRASHKYHSGGAWSNACCGHPEPQSDGLGAFIMQAARQRLYEEMGFLCGAMEEISCEYYQARVSQTMLEHEIDHIFKVAYRGEALLPNQNEVQAWRWITSEDLLSEIAQKPQMLSEWLKILLPRIINKIENN